MNCTACIEYCTNRTLCDCFCTPTILDYGFPWLLMFVVILLIIGASCWIILRSDKK